MLGYKDPEEMTKNELGFWVRDSVKFFEKRFFDNGRLAPKYFLSSEQFCYIILRYWWREYVDQNKDLRQDIDIEAYESISHVIECYSYYDRKEWSKEELQEQLSQEQVLLAEKCISTCRINNREWLTWKKYLIDMCVVVYVIQEARKGNIEDIPEDAFNGLTPYELWDKLIEVQAILYPQYLDPEEEEKNRELSAALWKYAIDNNMANGLNNSFEPYGLLGEDA